MKEERLARYKELCAKAKEAPLSEDELAEQGALRLEYFAESGFEVTYITRDLHNSDVEYNIETEHEKMFSDEGIPIKFLIARVKTRDND